MLPITQLIDTGRWERPGAVAVTKAHLSVQSNSFIVVLLE